MVRLTIYMAQKMENEGLILITSRLYILELTAKVDIIDKYKYLGLILDLDYDTIAPVLASSAGRALRSIYSKFCKLTGLVYNAYK